MTGMNVQIVIATLQKKISDLTLTNVMLEAQIADLQSQLNSMKETQPIENPLDGSGTNENKTKEIDDSSSSPDDF
tara:strand:+ start:240 stop:464 length:225 start_codon:yes stop_codon:yes gene_type:complete